MSFHYLHIELNWNKVLDFETGGTIVMTLFCFCNRGPSVEIK